MSVRLHLSTRNDLSETPFQVYMLDLETGQEISALISPDYKSAAQAYSNLRELADALEDAAKRAGF